MRRTFTFNCVFPLLILLAGPVLVLPALAAPVTRVTDLYQFEVVVANTSKAERKSGLVNALEQVMVRATGDKRIGTHPAAAGLFEQVEGFVQQYGYSTRPVVIENDADEETDNATPEDEAMFGPAKVVPMETVLSGRFEPAVLERALREAELPVWGVSRPQVLILSSIEDGAGHRSAFDETVQPVLESAASIRGLPLKISGEGGLDARSVWKGDRLALQDAAQAAGVDYVQWSRIAKQPAADASEALAWVVEAALYQNGELAREWFFNASSEEVALRRLVDETADWMASRYAVVSRAGGSSVIGLHISGVKNLVDYVRVQEALGGQGALEKMEMVAVGHGTVIFRITTRSDPRQFEHGLKLTRRFVPASSMNQDMRAPIWLGELELFYQLVSN